MLKNKDKFIKVFGPIPYTTSKCPYESDCTKKCNWNNNCNGIKAFWDKEYKEPPEIATEEDAINQLSLRNDNGLYYPENKEMTTAALNILLRQLTTYKNQIKNYEDKEKANEHWDS